MEDLKDWMLVSEVAKKFKVTPQSVYLALRKNRLKSSAFPIQQVSCKYFGSPVPSIRGFCGRDKTLLMINVKDLIDYIGSRWDRKFSKHKGKPLYEEDEYSIQTAAPYLNISKERLYYLISSKKIESFKKGGAIVIKKKFLDDFLKR